MIKNDRLPFIDRLSENELGSIFSVIRSGDISCVSGGQLDAFEKQAASLFGNTYGVATCNGTAALHLAFFALNLSPGDEVIVPTYGFHGMVAPICQLGLTPVFCDVDAHTLTLDVDSAERLVTSKTKAILALHAWGNVANVDGLLELKRKYGLALVADASHAHGAKWDGKNIGAYFNVNIASFGKGKILSGGELGCLMTDDPVIRDRSLLFGHVNRVPKDLMGAIEKFDNAVGIKYRPHLLALEIVLPKFSRLAEYSARLGRNISLFGEQLIAKGLPCDLASVNPKAERAYWKFPVIFHEGCSIEVLDQIVPRLREEGIPAEKGNYSKLLHQNSIFSAFYKFGLRSSVPQAEGVRDRIIHMPEHMFYDDNMAEKVTNIFCNITGSLLAVPAVPRVNRGVQGGSPSL